MQVYFPVFFYISKLLQIEQKFTSKTPLIFLDFEIKLFSKINNKNMLTVIYDFFKVGCINPVSICNDLNLFLSNLTQLETDG